MLSALRIRVSLVSEVGVRGMHTSLPRYMPEPMRRRKKIDPVTIRAKEEKKRFKLAREIKKMQVGSKLLKPLDEMSLDPLIKRNVAAHMGRQVELSMEEEERKALALKQWNKRSIRLHKEDKHVINVMLKNTDQALNALRVTCPEVYERSVAVDLSIFPMTFKGPNLTPPLPRYESPDGDYVEVTRKFEGEDE